MDAKTRVTRRPPAFGDAFPSVLAAAQVDAPWAYQRLFEWLSRPVVGYLRGQGSDDPDGLANDVFLRTFTHLRSFEGDEERFRSWVFTIAHNLLSDERRRRRRRPTVADQPLPEGAGTRSTESEALTRLGADRVDALLRALAPDQRDVLLLRIVADLTVEQAAQAMGKTPGAVKQLQRRGLDALRRRLPGPEDGPGRTLSLPSGVHVP